MTGQDRGWAAPLVESKADCVKQIADALGVQAPAMSTGAKEPKQIFDLVDDQLGLGVRPGTKQALARAIVESSGQPWSPDYESRGGTVTLGGLKAVLRAVHFFLGR